MYIDPSYLFLSYYIYTVDTTEKKKHFKTHALFLLGVANFLICLLIIIITILAIGVAVQIWVGHDHTVQKSDLPSEAGAGVSRGTSR